jgi:hypothetical protein
MSDISRHEKPTRNSSSFPESGHILNENGSISIVGEQSVRIGTVSDRDIIVIGSDPKRIVYGVPLAITRLTDSRTPDSSGGERVAVNLDSESRACLVEKGGFGLSNGTLTYRFDIENGYLVLRKSTDNNDNHIVATFGTNN